MGDCDIDKLKYGKSIRSLTMNDDYVITNQYQMITANIPAVGLLGRALGVSSTSKVSKFKLSGRM